MESPEEFPEGMAIRSHNHRWDETGPELEVSDGLDQFDLLHFSGWHGSFSTFRKTGMEDVVLAQGFAD